MRKEGLAPVKDLVHENVALAAPDLVEQRDGKGQRRLELAIVGSIQPVPPEILVGDRDFDHPVVVADLGLDKVNNVGCLVGIRRSLEGHQQAYEQCWCNVFHGRLLLRSDFRAE